MSISRFAVAAAAILFVSGCGSGDNGGTPPTPTPASVTVSVTGSTTLSSIGDTRPVAAVVRDANNAVINNASVSWTSSNTAAVTVSPATGLTTTATAAGNGSSNVRAQSGTVSDQTTLTVAQAFASLAVTPPTATINKSAPGNTVQLTATPKDARGNNIAGLPAASFTSSNNAIATVNATGLVTAVDVGSATITASLTSGAVTQTGTSTITVQGAPAPQNFNITAGAGGDVFNPVAQTIRVGDQVTWIFTGSHTVTFSGGASPPANIGTVANPQIGGSVARTFTTAGTYPYHCELHGSATTGMRGTITVNP